VGGRAPAEVAQARGQGAESQEPSLPWAAVQRTSKLFVRVYWRSRLHYSTTSYKGRPINSISEYFQVDPDCLYPKIRERIKATPSVEIQVHSRLRCYKDNLRNERFTKRTSAF
jgi:hypothetical protein